jgi:hypothetical protein
VQRKDAELVTEVSTCGGYRSRKGWTEISLDKLAQIHAQVNSSKLTFTFNLGPLKKKKTIDISKKMVHHTPTED